MSADMNSLGRIIAYVALAGALFATAITLNDRRYPTVDAPGRSAAPSARDAELARCKAIGTAAAEDAGCKAAWEANRKRFFRSGKLYQDRLTDAVPDTPGVVPAGDDLPNTPPRPPATQNSSRPALDIAGPLK
jgi:conjugative transfer region protein TrbK